MTDQVTYRCPVPDCTWTITDDRKDTLSAAVMMRLAGRQGDETARMMAGRMAVDHDQKLVDTIGQHLRSHPELRNDPQVPEAAAYLVHQTRKAITDGHMDGGDRE